MSVTNHAAGIGTYSQGMTMSSLKASLATGVLKLVYGRQDEKDRRVIIGIIPCVEGPSFSNRMIFVEDGVANTRSEKDTHGTSPARPERVANARLPRTMDE